MKYDKQQQVHQNILLLLQKKHHNVTTHYGVPAQRAQNVYFFTRFQTGVAITPFCTLVTVITSSVAPSAL